MANLPANPGEALWIGPNGGQNHFNVGIGQGTSNTGGDHTDYSQAQIVADTVNEPDKFFLNAAGNPVFRINASAGTTTTNTKHPRSELRELLANGTSKAAWDGRTGEHRMKGRSRIITVTNNRPWICFFQCHGSDGSPNSSDLFRVQTEGTNGTSTNLSLICRRTPPGSGSEIRTVIRTGYDVDDWVSWETAITDGLLQIWLDGTEVLKVPGMGQILSYWKTGCYLQDSVGEGASSSAWGAVEMERGSLQVWHTGTPTPTTPVFTGGTDPGGGAGGGAGNDTQPPSTPGGLTATPRADGVRLNWSASTDNVGVDHYNVYRSTGAGGSDDGSGDLSTAAGRFGWGAPLPSSDEFDYTGAPDSSKWNVYDGPGHDGNGLRAPGRVTVANGKMTLTGLAGSANTGGLEHRLDRQYGRWEVRCRSYYTADPTNPGGQDGGYHPVLIVWTDDVSWPAGGEYDFLENGEPGEQSAGGFMHYPSLNGSDHQIEVPGSPADQREFHNIAFEWTADGLAGWVDAQPWFSFSGGAAADRDDIQAMPSGHLTVQLDAFQASSCIASTMEVDWVRVYSLTPSGGGSGGGGTASATVGKTSAGASTTTSSADKMVASQATAGADGTLTVGHARVWLDSSGSTTSRMLVYADSSGAPGAKLATSDQITITATSAGVRDYVFSGAAQIDITSGTPYWVAVAWDDPGTPSITYSRDNTSSKRVERSDITYGTFPSPWGTSTGTFAGPIDAWLETEVAATGGGGTTTTTSSFGKTTDGANASVSSSDKAIASKFTANATGTLTGGHARIWLTGGSTTAKVCVYANSGGAPGALLAQSDAKTVSNTSEQVADFVFSGAQQIAITSGTDYWLAISWQDPGSSSVNYSRDPTTSSTLAVSSYLPSPFGTGTSQSGPIDVYVDVTSAGGSSGGGGSVGGGGAQTGQALIAQTAATTYLDTDVSTTGSQTRGVGGIPTPAAGPNVVLVTADSSSRLNITTSGQTYDGRGHSVAGITITADNVTVQNFNIHDASHDGVSIVGTGCTVQNCDFARIDDGGTGDINGITLFGDGHKILYNDAGVSDFMATGSIGGSHTDFIQTWNTSSKRSTSNLIVQGNRVVGPATSDARFVHQFVQGEGENSTDGGGGGTGTSSGWLIADNILDFACVNQAINLLDIHQVDITRNQFNGSASKRVGTGDGTDNVRYWTDNTGSGTYGSVGVSTTSGSGPVGVVNGGTPQTYTYAVTAVDAAGNESAQGTIGGTAGGPDTDPPTVPTNLTAVTNDARIGLTWDQASDTGSGVGAYRVYRDGTLATSTSRASWVDVDVANGTAYAYTVSAVDQAGNESAQSAAVTATPAVVSGGGAVLLPGRLPDGRVEVAIAWAADLSTAETTWLWSDITADVRQDPGVSTSLGRNDESATSNPANLTVVLDNAAGDYSLGTGSAHYPYVRRNTPVRVRVDPGDGFGWRTLFLGFADGFTPGWDSLTGRIPVVTLSASGTLRRLAQGSAPVQSAYRRVMTALDSVVAYWPFEEGSSARYAPAVRGGDNMVLSVDSATPGAPPGRPDWASSGSFDCSAALPRLGRAYFQADVDAYTNTGASQVRFLLAIPDNGLDDGTVLAHFSMTGTIHRWDLTYEVVNGATGLGLFRYNASDGSLHSSDQIGFALNGLANRISLDWTQSGSNIIWTLAVREANADVDTAGFFRGTLASRTAGIVSHIEINPHNADIDAAFGHLTVENAISSVFASDEALVANFGETVGGDSGRLARICAENRVPIQTYDAPGTLGDLDEMGPQLVAPLLDLLHECEVADQGQLWDGRNAGLSYTTRRRRELGTVKLTVDAVAGELGGDFAPVDDDQRNRNRMTVTRLHGVTVTYEDADGPLGTSAIGIYDDSITVNTAHDEMALTFAEWFVVLGTVEGYRYPSVTVDLAASPQLATAVLDIVPGERISVTGLDTTLAGFPDATVSLIVEGIAHEISTRQWRVTFRCSPYAPWAIGLGGGGGVGDTGYGTSGYGTGGYGE